MPYHQDTKEHKEKQDVNFVLLGALGVLVVRFFILIFHHDHSLTIPVDWPWARLAEEFRLSIF
jgi:hypothetical protein